jgi:tRNA(Met) C34 N-acetyltransferase TmcA
MVIIIQKNANTSKLKPTPKTQNTWHNQYTNPQQQQKPTKKIAKNKTTTTQTQTQQKTKQQNNKNKKEILSIELI